MNSKLNLQISSRVLVIAVAMFMAVPLSTGTETAPVTQIFDQNMAMSAISPSDDIVIRPESDLNTLEGEIFDAPACKMGTPTGKVGSRYRSSLRVGINDFGSLGVGLRGHSGYVDAALPVSALPAATAGVSEGPTSTSVATSGSKISAASSTSVSAGTAFQMPIGPANENLAVGWWGEGWLIDSDVTSIATHYPTNGPNGPITQVDDFYLESSRYVTYRVTVDLGGDGEMLTDFEWTLDRDDCDLTLRTTIENQSDSAINVDYKRIVDWDNLNDQGALGTNLGFYHAQWNEDGRTASATRYHTVGKTSMPLYECRTTALGTELPDTIDLDAWDDRTVTGVGSSHVTGTYNGDGNAGFHFSRDNLPVGGTWTTFLRYECDHFVQPLRVDPTYSDL